MLNFVLSSVSRWDNYKELHFSQDGGPPHLLLLAFGMGVKTNRMASAKFRTYSVSLIFCRDRPNRKLPAKTNQTRWTGKTNSRYFCGRFSCYRGQKWEIYCYVVDRSSLWLRKAAVK